jgi:general stress protein CsbA
MLEEVLRLLALIRTVVYISIALTSALIASAYYRAYKKEKPTWIIRAVMTLFLTLSFSFAFYTITSIINFLDGVSLRYRLVVSLLALTNIPLFLAIINFWGASISSKETNKLKRKK